jgi:intracellular sulfur oxidation DsrE/DsrF family protein
MNRFIKAVLVSAAVAATPVFAADAAPALASVPATKSLRAVVQVSDNDVARWNLALNNVRNVQKDVGADKVDIELVVYGPGLGMLKDDSVVANRVQEAVAAGVRVLACRNTMQAQHVTEEDLVPGIGFVQAGVVEIIRKQAEGYGYLRP